MSPSWHAPRRPTTSARQGFEWPCRRAGLVPVAVATGSSTEAEAPCPGPIALSRRPAAHRGLPEHDGG